LHYTVNDDEMKDGDLVVVDIGAEYDYYCADLTRTYPVSGTFTKRQRELNNKDKFANETYLKNVSIGSYDLSKLNYAKQLNVLLKLKPVQNLLTGKLILKKIKDNWQKYDNTLINPYDMIRWEFMSCSKRTIGEYPDESSGFFNKSFCIFNINIFFLPVVNKLFTEQQTLKEFIEKNRIELEKKYDLSQLENLDS